MRCPYHHSLSLRLSVAPCSQVLAYRFNQLLIGLGPCSTNCTVCTPAAPHVADSSQCYIAVTHALALSKTGYRQRYLLMYFHCLAIENIIGTCGEARERCPIPIPILLKEAFPCIFGLFLSSCPTRKQDRCTKNGTAV